MKLRLPRPTSVFTGIVMICLYLPIIAVVVVPATIFSVRWWARWPESA